jgi:hypothetical protein
VYPKVSGLSRNETNKQTNNKQQQQQQQQQQ